MFLLYLDELDLSKSQMGLVLSLLPFCGLLALISAPSLTRWGRKRAFLALFGARKTVMAGLLLLPVIHAHWGASGAFIFLLGIIGLFAVFRAVGETAFYPWFQEFVPDHIRGKYSAVTTILSNLAAISALMIASRVVGRSSGIERFQWLIGLACLIGILSVLLMVPVPGGQPRQDRESGFTGIGEMLRTLGDRNFCAFLSALGCTTVAGILLITFLPLFLKEKVSLAPGTIVLLETVMPLGGILSSIFWGWSADRYGSRPTIVPSMMLGLVVPLYWLLFPRSGPETAALAAVAYFLNGAAAAGITISTGRLLFNSVIPEEKNTSYTALYYAWMGLSGGIAPFMAGWMLSSFATVRKDVGDWTFDAYSALFAISFALLLLGLVLYRRVQPDSDLLTRDVLRRVTQALRNGVALK